MCVKGCKVKAIKKVGGQPNNIIVFTTSQECRFEAQQQEQRRRQQRQRSQSSGQTTVICVCWWSWMWTYTLQIREISKTRDFRFKARIVGSGQVEEESNE